MADNNKFTVEGPSNAAQVSKEIQHKYDLTRRGLKLVMKKALDRLAASITQNIRIKLNRRSNGTLRDSVLDSREVIEDGDTITGVVGSRLSYAAIHEFGGTITPVKARRLWIPFRENQGVDGLPIVSISEFFNAPNSVILKNMAGLKEGTPTMPYIRPLFALKDSVRIPARPYIRPAFQKNAAGIAKTFGLFLQETWNIKK